MEFVKDWAFRALYFNKNLTRNAILMGIYLLSHCGEDGTISVFHKDIEEKIGCNEKTFYKTINFLCKEKINFTFPNGETVSEPFITRLPKAKGVSSEIVVKINHNDFTANEDTTNRNRLYDPYIDVDYKILQAKVLTHLRRKDLRTLLYLFFRFSKGGNLDKPLKFSDKENAHEAIARALNVSTQTARKALSRLINVYEIFEYENTPYLPDNRNIPAYYFVIKFAPYMNEPIYNQVTSSETIYNGEHVVNDYSERHFRSDRHFIRNVLRRLHKDGQFMSPPQAVNDVAALVNQYRTIAKNQYRRIEDVMFAALSVTPLIRGNLVHNSVRTLLKLT